VVLINQDQKYFNQYVVREYFIETDIFKYLQ